MRRMWRCVRGTPHLDFGIRRRAQQHELAAALQGAPGRVLDEVRALLVRQPRDHLAHVTSGLQWCTHEVQR